MKCEDPGVCKAYRKRPADLLHLFRCYRSDAFSFDCFTVYQCLTCHRFLGIRETCDDKTGSATVVCVEDDPSKIVPPAE